jgi:glycosidase
MNYKNSFLIALTMMVLTSCKIDDVTAEKALENSHKKVVYQVFTRLFGNTNTTNKPWGTIEENGVGKFNDFTNKALTAIKDLGVTHIWYTGVPHHDVIRDYTIFGISNDDPDVVKGRAGSPYAVKDYYTVNPDLAVNVENKLAEFEALIARSHQNGLKVIIDIVPNHVARNYHSISHPEGTEDFGASDDKSVVYNVHNNFYYNPNKAFEVPDFLEGYLPLDGEKNPLSDGKFNENPSKWTGNGSRASKPSFNDWYETVKVNYGISPKGKKDFNELPAGFEKESYKKHFEFWQDKSVPNSWIKFRDIALYWIEKGVDGFRYDMAEMVPVAFWSYMNSAIKTKNPNTFLLAEVYNPKMYRAYIKKGKMDYLYDKVQLYDTLKRVMQNSGLTDNIPPIQEDLADIEHQMLHFLENHDEQRIASQDFAGDARKGKPAMVVSATISTSPTMIYFAQELGEPAKEDAGFGKPSRTSIFDYVGVPSLQRWVNNKQFDGGQSTKEEKALRDFYKRLLNFTIHSSALMGEYQDIHQFNRENTQNYNHRVLSFVRWSNEEKLIVVSNFDSNKTYEFELKIPVEIIEKWELENQSYLLEDQLYQTQKFDLNVSKNLGTIKMTIAPLQSFILKI